MNKQITQKRLLMALSAAFLAAAILLLLTADLAHAGTARSANLLKADTLCINLNDGQPLIQEEDLLLSGLTVEREFFIENNSSCVVCYRLYLEDVSGGLEDMVIITIRDGDTVLFSSPASALTAENAATSIDALASGQRKYLTIHFTLPEECGNEAQSLRLRFTLCAEAFQA